MWACFFSADEKLEIGMNAETSNNIKDDDNNNKEREINSTMKDISSSKGRELQISSVLNDLLLKPDDPYLFDKLGEEITSMMRFSNNNNDTFGKSVPYIRELLLTVLRITHLVRTCTTMREGDGSIVLRKREREILCESFETAIMTLKKFLEELHEEETCSETSSGFGDQRINRLLHQGLYRGSNLLVVSDELDVLNQRGTRDEDDDDYYMKQDNPPQSFCGHDEDIKEQQEEEEE